MKSDKTSPSRQDAIGGRHFFGRVAKYLLGKSLPRPAAAVPRSFSRHLIPLLTCSTGGSVILAPL